MAEVLSKKRSRRGKALDPRERELKRLKLSVCDDTGFRLHLATYSQPRQRDELIERVVDEAGAERVRVTRLDLGETGPETNLVGLLRAHLREIDLPSGWRQAVMIIGIEQRLDYSSGSEGFAFLHQANLLRDALPEVAPVPVVLWLSRLASAALPAEAPDLWHWRAANFDFTGDKAPRLELLRELTAHRPEGNDRITDKQRRARIWILKELLEELEREGPPKSKRQAAERTTLLMQLTTELLRLGRASEAIPRLEQVVEAFRQIGDRRSEGIALGVLGVAYADVGELRRAIEHYEQFLGIAREIGDRRGEPGALGGLGHAYAALGETRRAIEQYEQQLAIAREVGEPRTEGAALANLGNLYAALGDAQSAIERHERALAIARKIGDRRIEAQTLGGMAVVCLALNKRRRADQLHEQSLEIAGETDDRKSEGSGLGGLGNAYSDAGDPQKALGYLEQALMIAREIGDRQGEAASLHNSALAFDQLGERGEAIRRMKEALRIYEQIETPRREDARAKLAQWQDDANDG